MMKSIVAVVALLQFSSAVWADDIKVTVVAILASDRNTNIDPKLQAIAAEIKTKDHSLTGFRVERTTAKPLPFNKKESFPLLNDLNAEVTVLDYDEKTDRIRLTVKAPQVGEITYSTVPGKFFPYLSRYQTDTDKERLVIAVMAKLEEKKKP